MVRLRGMWKEAIEKKSYVGKHDAVKQRLHKEKERKTDRMRVSSRKFPKMVE